MTLELPDRQIAVLNTRFFDADLLRESVQAWDLDFKPLSGHQKHREIAHVQQFIIGGIDHGYSRMATAIDQSGAPPAGKLTFTILGAGMGPLWWRGQHVDAGDILVFPRNSELRCVSGDDFENNVLSVTDDLLAAICERNELPLPTTETLGETFRPPSAALAMIRARLHALRTCDHSASGVDYQKIVERLVIEWHRADGYTRSGNMRGIRNRDRAMRVCLDVITDGNLAQVTPAGLCEQAGVSARTLEYAFKDRFGVGPATFVRVLRMIAVRDALTRHGPGKPSIGDLASGFGFWHSGQFARDYRRQFGESPSQTRAG